MALYVCPTCHGNGIVFVERKGYGGGTIQTCPTCHGTGYVGKVE